MRGRGLGRILLQAALRFAAEQTYSRTVLCVNAENERAQALYTGEGFRQAEAVACLTYVVQHQI
ncbi:GNAT family N-acetyltransferase [Paenibacillus rhizoplanae]